MTTAAICATRGFSWGPSFYRGEQYDSDLALYYLRSRYYNPATGRFMSRDPEAGRIRIPGTLHKYLFVNGDPVNRADPTGRESILETGSLDKIIGTTAVPALVEFVGTYVVLPAIDFAVSAWEVVTEFAADAKAVIKSNGVMKAYLCAELGTDAATAIGFIAEDEASDHQKEADEDRISKLTVQACGFFLFDDWGYDPTL